MIRRDLYINRIKPYINKKLVKVLTGQRRVGKSAILQLLYEDIRRQTPTSNFIYIDKEKYEFDFIRTHAELMQFIEMHKKECMNYLFIDEIQNIEGFERVIRSLYNEENFDIYCTGSNSTIFSSELSTYLAGRQISFHIGCLNFTEFCLFHNLSPVSESLNKYLRYGGLPFLMHLPEDETIRYEYLNNVYSTIFYRDIINRHNIRNPRFLTDLLKFLADNSGSMFSASKISAYLKNQKINMNVALILDYMHYMEEAYFINKVQRIDIHGKKQFEIGEKYYFEDIGLRNSVIGYNPFDIAKIIENIVFLHLKNNGFEIKIGEIDKNEIDFVATKNGETSYYQVAYLLSDDKTIEREFGNLLKIEDNYPKYVISMNPLLAPNTYKGIQHITLLEFLLQP